jgi:hypothetical protein
VSGVANNTTTVGRAYFDFDEPVSVGSTIYIWGAQLETGTYPTSYIPTVASTVTRSADTSTSATVTRASELVSILGDAFRSFYSSNIGTFFTEASIIGEKNNTSSSSFVSLGTTSNDVFTSFLVYDNRLNVGFIAPVLANITQFADLTGQTIKGVTSFNNSLTNNASSSSAINGTLYNANSVGNVVSAGDAATVGGYDRLGIGRTIRTSTFHNSINGRIKRLTYYPVRLPDAQLQTLTR